MQPLPIDVASSLVVIFKIFLQGDKADTGGAGTDTANLGWHPMTQGWAGQAPGEAWVLSRKEGRAKE